MKVSFLVTYYNQREYVKQSMDSILAIDKPCDWEILVGDDGSSDGTIEEVNRYVEQYPEKIKLYVMPRESGKKYDSVRRASANRLKILEKCSGDIFCTLDGDDFFCDKSFIKDALKIFNEDKGVSVVAFGYKYFTSGVYGKDIILPARARGHVDKRSYLRSFYLPAGACVHRLCWGKDRINYIKKIGYFDDNNIVINSLNFGEMYAFDRPIYSYRQTGVSVYTSMNAVEQAVLNVQGFDVDKHLIDESYYVDLLQRNATCILTVYVWNKRLKELLGKETYDRYLNSCQSANDSLLYKLMKYDYLHQDTKREVTSLINKLVLKHLKFTVKQYIGYVKHLGRSIK